MSGTPATHGAHAMPPATGTEGRVCDDIARRQALGLHKYGRTVEDNPLTIRQWMQHAYEETLDQAIYLKRAMEEMDAQARQASPEREG